MAQAAVAADRAPRSWQPVFLSIFPTIEKSIRFAFRGFPQEKREECVQAALANACVACARLWSRGCLDRLYPTALARFAIAQVREGRLVGSSLNNKDVLSQYAKRKHGLIVQHMGGAGSSWEAWSDWLRDGWRTPVPDQVWFRIDFPRWLASLSPLNQETAQLLASGHSTNEVAQRFSISAGRVSQIRRELSNSWRRFHGEVDSN